MGQVETVRVKHGDGFMVINADDFDAAVHVPFDAPDAGADSGKKTDAKGKKAGADSGKK